MVSSAAERRRGAGHALAQPLRDTRRNLHFFARAGYIFCSYKSFALRTHLLSRLRGDQVEAAWAAQHEWGGAQLYAIAIDLQGFHLKGAQWLSARPDICPPEWIAVLSRLQDRCPPLRRTEVETVLRAELGLSIDEAFARFDDTPIGAASIAQVHRAWLHPTRRWCGLWRSCRPVAVKVQRPRAEYLMMRDLRNIRAFFSLPFVRSSLAWDPMVILDQVDSEMEHEFDFIGEARAMDAVSEVLRRPPPGRFRWLREAAFYRPPVQVPHSVSGMVTKRVLVMDFLPGMQLSRLVREVGAARAVDAAQAAVHVLDNPSAPQALSQPAVGDIFGRLRRTRARSSTRHTNTGVGTFITEESASSATTSSRSLTRGQRAASRRLLRALAEAYGRMLFEDGFEGVHADPHPGNIVIRPGLRGFRVGLVDFGQTKSYDLSMRLRLARMVEALCAAGGAAGRASSEDVVAAFQGLGIRWNSSRPLAEQRAAVAATATEWYDTSPLPQPFSQDPTSPNYPVLALGRITAFPVEILYFVRAIQYLRAMGGYMGVEWSLVEVWRPHARRLIRRHGKNPNAWEYNLRGIDLPQPNLS